MAKQPIYDTLEMNNIAEYNDFYYYIPTGNAYNAQWSLYPRPLLPPHFIFPPFLPYIPFPVPLPSNQPFLE